MDQREYLDLLGRMEKAEESVTPFAIPADDEIVIVGDPNQTQTNSHDFVITFRIPKKENGRITYMRHEVEYNDVIITGRNDPKIIRAMNDLYPFFKKVTEDGGIEKFTEEEKLALVAEFSDEITDRLYSVVAAVLGVDERLRDYMEYGSVLQAVGQIFSQYPEMVNETGTFFPSSSAERTRMRPL